jgi:hypothetical protein
MVQAYQELITILDLDGNAAILRFRLASAYRSVLRNDLRMILAGMMGELWHVG